MARSDRLRGVDVDRLESGPTTEPSAHDWESSPAQPWPGPASATDDSWEPEDDSWDPVLPDTWPAPHPEEDVRGPGDRAPSAEGPDAAAWTDAARSEAEWATAAVTDRLGRARDESRAQPPGAARMALGLATLAAQRLRGGVPVGDGFVTGVGLVQQTAIGLRELGHRVLAPASRLAAGTVTRAAAVPVAGVPVRMALRARGRLATVVADARAAGRETVDAGRADAERVLRQGADQARRMAEQIVGRLVAGPRTEWSTLDETAGRRRRR